MTDLICTITFLSDWHCGTGAGASATLDAVVARDTTGCPLVPGRTLRGILRDGVRQLAAHGHLKEPLQQSELVLFGDEGFDMMKPTGDRHVRGTRPGRLQFTDACISADVTRHLATLLSGSKEQEQEAKRLRATLFRSIAMTAIGEHGTVKAKSLRMIEVAVPLTLTARITLTPRPLTAHVRVDGEDMIEEGWPNILRDAALFTDGIGSGRTRGLGRCRIEFGGLA
ncbi:RAMP superfamily CRISPR-associated protein [Rhabdaerophilum sp. SD176]|uniref:RAMP superfamily CRISPR-associated protein n=1 Tax=Rhabdaerophilum sp. SD176 TaxID=2983548 RepID=UPI0024DF3F84|nr:RAMP superfamily CRISPR-associated protein [Rhabdaerophilum sp. SD176]